ncbi:MAG: MFS transporter, partial [Solirubrobacteraceae bacterium]
VLLIITALLFEGHNLTAASLTVALIVVFFFASAGVSSAYLTVSEIFPMETRALCISVFYAVGTGIGGITGPLLFSALIKTGSYSQAALALIIGAIMMVIGGVVELIYGVKAEGQGLEHIAKPLTAEDGDGGSAPSAAPAAADPAPVRPRTSRFRSADLRPRLRRFARRRAALGGLALAGPGRLLGRFAPA